MKFKNTDPFAIYDPSEAKNDIDSEIHWEDFLTSLKDEFKDYLGKQMFVEGYEMGWQRRSGTMEFMIEDSRDVFDKIIPDTQHLSYYLYKLDKHKYVARIYHHDAPTGETYHMTLKDAA